MAYIQPNKMLPPTARVIRPYQCSMIATEGPNILGKLNMSGVEIPYNTQFTTRMILNPGAINQPLLYGFLGSNVTFVLLKFTYDESDPLCMIEEEQFIKYYYQDQPSVKRYANKLLLLTGNSIHRIPQIYLENPGEVKVYVDALIANLEQSDITSEEADITTVSNLYHNSILSDMLWVQSNLTSGSTQLQVMNSDGYIEVYVDYIDISSIETRYETNELILTTVSDVSIILEFLSTFEMYQARSRISWVMKFPNERYLTADSPSVDVIAPVFSINPSIIPISPNTYVYPYSSGSTLLPAAIINYFITGITDARDGSIPINNTNITIREYGHVEILTGITSVGVYDIVMTVADNANNQTMLNFIMICDDVPPVITFKPIASGTGFTMTTTDMTLPSDGITYNDIIIKSVDNVYDTVDGTIPNMDIIITIDAVSGATGLTHITEMGDYIVTYTVYDRGGNSATYEKIVRYTGYVILIANDIYEVAPNVTIMDFRYFGTTGTSATIVLSGHLFEIYNNSGVTNEEFIWDFGGLGEYNFGSGSTGVITVTVEGILYTITFTGRSSLLFTITNSGPSSDYFMINSSGISFTYESGQSSTFEISTNKSWTITPSALTYFELSNYNGTGTTTLTVTTLINNISVENYTDSINILVDSGSIHDIKTVSLIQTHN
jgi:hypothetical protein